ncbi:hypothetical protein P7D22_09845 [Lichenihabitans sp. Uapishka_5]|uniref:hypothetical protein n=1 Tax=Lichenihabitans sp. Uapishka_5 TaxID=3037302 RepID=UPI0029E8283D|nr:hypothetical protein [Lichenihabitans sp. Uapishka_5]MDX7951468.1 hypothetical protein [Lichenihabitans sp. Uapishka_5]
MQSQAYFLALRNAQRKRRVEIGGGTHMILAEAQRMQAFRAISDLLAKADQ